MITLYKNLSTREATIVSYGITLKVPLCAVLICEELAIQQFKGSWLCKDHLETVQKMQKREPTS